MKAKDIMTSSPITITQDKLVKDAAKLMTEKNISALPIVDGEGNLVGIITESDFVGSAVDIPHALASIKQLFNENFSGGKNVEEICAKAKEKPLKDVMTKNVRTISESVSLTDVVTLMIEKELKRVPVVDGKKLVGIITRKDIMKGFSKS